MSKHQKVEYTLATKIHLPNAKLDLFSLPHRKPLVIHQAASSTEPLPMIIDENGKPVENLVHKQLDVIKTQKIRK
jgi:hypothetical protein